MSRYMPLTDVDHPIPTILIDTHAPLYALHATADYRIRIVTQLLETLTSKQRTCNDPTLINDLMGGDGHSVTRRLRCAGRYGATLTSAAVVVNT